MVGCAPAASAPLASASRGAQPGSPPATAYQTFDVVWTNVNDLHFDPSHNGIDWKAVRESYRPRIEETRSNGDVRRLLREMIGELGQSHFVVIPQSRGLNEDNKHQGGNGTIGMRLGWVEGKATVVAVRRESPAAIAGVRPGWVIAKVNGKDPTVAFESLLKALAESDSPLLAGEAALKLDHWATDAVGMTHLFSFTDPAGSTQEREIEFVEVEGTPVKFSNLPEIPTLFESRWLSREDLLQLGAELSGDTVPRIGYIQFNIWMFPIMMPLADAVDEFRDAEGIVVDLRRNTGGLGGLAMGVAGHFVNDEVSLGTMTMRETELKFVVNPQRATMDGRLVVPYAGPLALLVDAGTASTSEVFGAGLQQLGRARVFGRNSMGAALPARTVQLPNGDVFMFAIANFTGPAGQSIEGTGVVPDQPVILSPSILDAQWDPDLRAAVDWIAAETNP